MSTFGDIERVFADLYPYRWAFAAGVLVFIVALTHYAATGRAGIIRYGAIACRWA